MYSSVPDWLVWQLLDSTFPTGGFVHSNGLEAAIHFGQITSAHEITPFLRSLLHQTASTLCPYLSASHILNVDDQTARIALDLRLDATLPNHVANRASRQQGHSLLFTAEHLQPLVPPALTAYRKAAMTGLAPAHLPVAYGLTLRLLNIPLDHALRMFLFQSLRGSLSAAVRLGAVGPLQAQQIQLLMTEHLDHAHRLAQAQTPDTAAQTSPLVDLFQAAQDRLYSRLFQS